MPIANCLINPECNSGPDDLVQLWAEASGKSAKHMTVNIQQVSGQFGHHYAVTAQLFLPSIWPPKDVSALQTGLAKSLSRHFSQPLDAILVMTTIIGSGHVVENGTEVRW